MRPSPIQMKATIFHVLFCKFPRIYITKVNLPITSVNLRLQKTLPTRELDQSITRSHQESVVKITRTSLQVVNRPCTQKANKHKLPASALDAVTPPQPFLQYLVDWRKTGFSLETASLQSPLFAYAS